MTATDTQSYAYEVEAADGSKHVTRDCDAQTVIAQIGKMNIFAISGGRVVAYPDGINLPVSHGYRVRIRLAANDTYIVQRVFRRGTQEWIKGEMTEVYCEDLSDIAYYASCYVNVDFPLLAEEMNG